MDPLLDEFCTRFAAGAGSEWVWTLLSGNIRAVIHPEWGLTHCPLSGQLAYEDSFLDAAADELIEAIIAAADAIVGYDENLRQRLLQICHLEELPHA